MKVRAAAVLLLFIAYASPALAEENSVAAQSRITGVTVYGDRALVTRSASVNLSPGSSTIVFDSLPLPLDPDSIRAEGKGEGARIGGVTVKSVFLERLQEKRIQELEEAIQSLNRKIESIDARRTALEAQRAFIESIRVGWGERISKELAAGKPSAAELGEAAKFVGDGVGRVEEARYDAEAEKKPLVDRLTALKKELDQAKAGRRKEVRRVEVAVDADRQGRFALDLSYVVPQAHWEPSYDVRLAPDGKSATLTYRAMVWQKTGEEWPGVKLALSTARPEVGGAPPELTPWHVSLWEPPRYEPRRALKLEMAPAPAPMAGAARMADEAMPEAPAPPVQAQVTEGETSVLFSIAEPVDVPADGTLRGSVIAQRQVPVIPQYFTVPKLSPRVYLKSQVVNETPYPLLAGEVNVFNDTAFTGKAALKTVAAGEKFDLFFGADDRLKVKREVERSRKEGGLFGGNRLSYRCRVELQNFRKEAVTVALADQLPLAGNEEIKVSLEEAAPKPDERKDDGTVVWKVALKPGEKREVRYDIVIDYPRGRELSGAE